MPSKIMSTEPNNKLNLITSFKQTFHLGLTKIA